MIGRHTGAPAETPERWGLFEAPPEPAREPLLHVEPGWSPLRLSGAVLASAWPWWLAGSLLLIIFNSASMMLSVAIGGMIDSAIAPAAQGASLIEITGSLVLWSLALAGLYAAMNVSWRFGGRLGWFGVQRAQYEMSQCVLGRVLDERGMAHTAPPGALLSVATADVRRACVVIYAVVYPPGQLVGLVVATGILSAIHPLLGLCVLLGLPLVLGLMHVVALPLRRRSVTEQQGLADAAAAAGDLVAGYRVLRGLHAHPVAAQRYRTISRQALRSTVAARAAEAAFEGASATISQLFAAGILVIAALLAFDGSVTVGELVTVAGVTVMLMGPMDALVGTLGTFWAISQASARRVLDLIRTPPHDAALGTFEADHPAEKPQHLTFDRVELGGGVRLDTVIAPGEFVVLDLPARAHAALGEILALRRLPADGSVRYGGRLLATYRPGRLRAHVLVVPHQSGLLAGTVATNVAASAAGDLDPTAVVGALTVAALDPAELADGIDTVTGDGGAELSGGQRQRIALARAVAADAPVLVLTEPTTSIDTATELDVAANLRAERAGRTTVVMTTSPALRRVADRVIGPTNPAGNA